METLERIEALGKEIAEKKEELAALLKESRQSIPDFTVNTADGPKPLSALFGDSSDMILISNMGKGCPYCTLWADGLNGQYPEISTRAPFVLMSADEIDTAVAFANSRGWRFPIVSSPDRELQKHIGVYIDGSAYPAALGLRKTEDGIELVAKTFFGPGDDFCPAWPLMALLQDGSNGWEPKYRL